VVFDKAYVDFKHLEVLDARGVSWVMRAKDNMLYEVMGQHATGRREPHDTVKYASSFSEPEAATAGVMGQQLPRKRQYVCKKCKVLSDERIRLTGVNTKRKSNKRCSWPIFSGIMKMPSDGKYGQRCLPISCCGSSPSTTSASASSAGS